MLGDSFNSSLVAIVAVDPDVMKDWAASEGIKVLLLLLFITLKASYSAQLKKPLFLVITVWESSTAL